MAVLDAILICICTFFKYLILQPLYRFFNNQERVLPPSEIEARFLTGYINSSSPNAGASTFPYLHFHLFRNTPSIVAFVRLVARLATIKNALVRCGERAGAVFTGEMRYYR